jgi:hypothetical protein
MIRHTFCNRERRTARLHLNPDYNEWQTHFRNWTGDSGGPLTVKLPAGLNAAEAQPVNLRGQKTGQAMPITDGKLNFSLPAYAPASFILH